MKLVILHGSYEAVVAPAAIILARNILLSIWAISVGLLLSVGRSTLAANVVEKSGESWVQSGG